MKKTNLLLILLLVSSLFLRIIRIDYPKNYVFDEVYYPFTAKEYLKGNKEAWEWWTKAPEGHAYAWVNPPLAQEIMAGSMFILKNTDSLAWRLPGVVMGVLSVYLVYYLGVLLFKKDTIALLSALIFSIDGLNFVQSRTGMLDIYLVTFCLLSFVFFIKNKFSISAIFLGMALANKWTAVYLLGLFILLLIKYRLPIKIFKFLVIPPVIYLLIYLPFFLTGHTLNQFLQLINQQWWYHTHLKAAHDYASSWWSWPLNLYPVWYFVDYQKDKIANIFAFGNPVVFWVGTIAILLTVRDYLKKRSESLLLVLAGFFFLWLPWAISPRLMFIYYFSPSVPFLSLALGYQLSLGLDKKKSQPMIIIFLSLMILSFILVYPFLTGIPIPKEFIKLFFLINMSKNPF
ncbi:phospholipid carrier-dependent glycosyltransferase [Candidatus Daviesbacteria bacterium]|nr:phospholipid carrier-dependent glycosyltransferase [Candidatus Daviesbacteria bacterium]